MAVKFRNKATEAKLIIEAVKPYQVVLSELQLERTLSKKQINMKQPNILYFPNSQNTALTPQAPGMLEALMSRHAMKSKNSDQPRLHNRPKTVSNLKNKKEVNQTSEISEKEKPTQDSLPRYITNTSRKEVIYIGDYEIGNEIGKGAYGLVRIGTHRLTGEKVAIKIYEKIGMLNPIRKQSVEREIKILTKLKHPNIIKLITTIDTVSSINLVFEYVSGCSLIEYLKSRSSRKIEETQAKGIFKQILMALEFCHSLGISHRDIKLENVLMDEFHNVKLIDFGFSTYIVSEKKVQLFCGTSSYMAPEIVGNKEALGPPTDIWAAGVLLFILITGSFPFKALQTKELYSKIQRVMYIAPLGLSSAAKELFKDIFVYNPYQRPTATKLLEHPWLNSPDKNLSFNNRTTTGMTLLFNKTFC